MGFLINKNKYKKVIVKYFSFIFPNVVSRFKILNFNNNKKLDHDEFCIDKSKINLS